MSETTQESALTPVPILGTGQIITNVLALFIKRFPKILILCLPAGLALGLVFYLGIRWIDSGFIGAPSFIPWWLMNPFTVFSAAIGLAMGLSAGPLAEAYHRYYTTRRVPLGACMKAIIRRPLAALIMGVIVAGATLLPFAALSWATSARLGLFVGSVALVIGMYVLGFWGLALPAISRDRMGFGGFGRSKNLSKDYRWRIAGTCFVLFFAALLAGGLVGAGLVLLGQLILAELLGIQGLGFFGTNTDLFEVLMLIDFCLSFTIIVALIVLGLAAIRARMVEIKEPPDIEDMVAVFD